MKIGKLVLMLLVSGAALIWASWWFNAPAVGDEAVSGSGMVAVLKLKERLLDEPSLINNVIRRHYPELHMGIRLVLAVNDNG